MTPQRCASELAKMLSRFAKAKALPENWTPNDFVSLVAEYKNLVAEIKEGSAKEEDSVKGGPLSAEQVKAWIRKHGIPGAYESMVEGAKAADAAARKGLKADKKL
ncbi:MAG: hypothetical protein K9N21_02750 [Deltaproteobacteria bacterium]|nr:hypothetical protein [Deltaproteobacteria bacterium]